MIDLLTREGKNGFTEGTTCIILRQRITNPPHKDTMEKKFTQDQIADALGVQKYIVAAWEKQFDIIPLQEDSNITYTIQNLESFRTIKELLYEKGLTMAAVKKSLQDTHVIFEGKTLMAATPLFFDVKKAAQRESEISSEKLDPAAVTSKLLHIRSQLMKISSSL